MPTTVQSTEKPGDGSTARTAPIGANGESAKCDHDREGCPGQDGREGTQERIGDRLTRAAAQGPEHPQVLPARRGDPSDGQSREEQGRQSGNDAEDARRDRLGLGRRLDPGRHHRRDVEAVDRVSGEEADDLAFDRGHVRTPVHQAKLVGGVHGLMVREEASRRRRGEEDVRPILVDVVSHHLVVGHHDADQRGAEHADGSLAGRAEPDGIDLRQRVGPDREAFADVPAERPRRGNGHHELVGPVGIGEPPLCHGRLVLVEEHTVEAADRGHLPVCATSCRWEISPVTLAE